MTIYLIDFENVSIGGLKGASELGQNDLVFLFSSKNAARLTTATLATFNSTTLKFVEVPVKKQSLDMHLVSYLGYLIGTTDAEHFIIISNDHDYDNIMAFWRANGRNVTVERRGSIAVNPAQDNKPSENRRRRRSSSNTQAAPAVQTEAGKAIAGDTAAEEKKPESKKRGRSVSTVNTDQKAAGTVSEDAKNDKAAAIREELSKVYDEAVCKDVLRIISSHSDERNPLTSIHNDLRDTYQDPDYLDIYKIIKPILSPAPGRRSRHNTKTANTSQKPASDKAPNSSVTRINNEVQKILSKAKYETEIISHVAGLAAKSHGVKNGKMAVYRGIISKYGREKGLEIYDKLKALLSDPGLWE
ncbi:MAG: hypothetical protein IJM34_12710 [Lachnospiraceae bacterium]|nr:hypothetical protein [Lachnospiraceae bacterium]